MGESGCVGWMFSKKGIFSFPKAQFTEDQLMETIWPKTKAVLEKTLTPGLYNLWIKPLAARARDGVLELTAPNAFVAAWVRERLSSQVAEAAAVVMASPSWRMVSTRSWSTTTSREATGAPFRDVARAMYVTLLQYYSA